MSLLSIILVLVVIGILLWLIETYAPISPTMKKIIDAIVVIGIVLWLLQILGILDAANQVRVQPVR